MAAMRASRATLVNLADPEAGYVNLRVGFHCGELREVARVMHKRASLDLGTGSVVTNVVGKRNARFCLCT